MENFIKETIAWAAIGSVGVGVIYFAMVCALGGGFFVGAAMDNGATNLLGEMTSLKTSTAHTVNYFTGFDEMEEENKRLKQALAEANHTLAHTKKMEAENARLTKLLGMKEEEKNLNMIGSRVIGRNWDDPWGSLLIDVGEKQGVCLKDPVMTQEGMVGMIGFVGESFSRVDTLTANKTEIGGSCIESGDVGIVAKGEDAGSCTIGYLPKESAIKVGDFIETSGLGGIIPSGLPIGTVSHVGVAQDGLSKYGIITPFVNVKTVQNLCVIRMTTK